MSNSPSPKSSGFSLSDGLWFLCAALVAGAYLFRVPGYHYDEAWIANYGARIAFEPSFWPVFGMNQYTVPVMSYLLGGFFRLLNDASLEIARCVYFGMNLVSFALLFRWVKRIKPSSDWVFALLWCTAPLSIFNQRLFLEVTTGYAFFFSLVLWAFTLAFFYRRSWFFLGLGLLAFVLGMASHILFVSVAFAGLWAAWKTSPESFEKPGVKTAVTVVFGCILVLVISASTSNIGTGTKVKSLVAAGLVVALLASIWGRWWKQKWTALPTRIAGWILGVGAVAALFTFILFELSGVWPSSQTTGHLNYLGILPGLAMAGLAFQQIWAARRQPLVATWTQAWLVVLTVTILTVYKPTSARYWEMPWLFFLITTAVAWDGRKYRLALSLLAGLSLGAMAINYFSFTLQQGATGNEYRLLWVKDRAVDYRPVIQPYHYLREAKGLCAEDQIGVDVYRNLAVLETYRAFEVKAGREAHCPANQAPRKFWIGAVGSHPGTPVEGTQPGWGDFAIFQD